MLHKLPFQCGISENVLAPNTSLNSKSSYGISGNFSLPYLRKISEIKQHIIDPFFSTSFIQKVKNLQRDQGLIDVIKKQTAICTFKTQSLLVYALSIFTTVLVYGQSSEKVAAQQNTKNKGVDLTVANPDFSKVMGSDFKNNNIYWLGESHATNENSKIAYKYLKHLTETTGVKYCLIEATYLDEIMLNDYLKTGNDATLDSILDNYQGTFGYSKEYKEYFKKLQQLNQSLSPQNKFKFVSIDIEHHPLAAHKYLKKKLTKFNPIATDLLLSHLDTMKKWDLYGPLTADFKVNEKRYRDLLGVDYEPIYYHIRNIDFLFTAQKNPNFDKIRDSLIFENFKTRNNQFDFAKNKTFAFWGTSHCYQSETSDGVQ